LPAWLLDRVTGAGECDQFSLQTEQRVVQFDQIQSCGLSNCRRVTNTIQSAAHTITLSDQRQATVDVVLSPTIKTIYAINIFTFFLFLPRFEIYFIVLCYFISVIFLYM